MFVLTAEAKSGPLLCWDLLSDVAVVWLQQLQGINGLGFSCTQLLDNTVVARRISTVFKHADVSTYPSIDDQMRCIFVEATISRLEQLNDSIVLIN